MNTTSAIKYQIINGKNGMPAFGGRLKEIEIEQIAKYVLDNAKNKILKLIKKNYNFTNKYIILSI